MPVLNGGLRIVVSKSVPEFAALPDPETGEDNLAESLAVFFPRVVPPARPDNQILAALRDDFDRHRMKFAVRQ